MRFEFYLRLARLLPAKIRYAVVVDAFSKASVDKYPGLHVDDIGYDRLIEAAFPDLRYDSFWTLLSARGWWCLAILFLATSCATLPSPPVENPAEKPISECAALTWCWDNLVLSHITPAMLAANVGSFCPKASKLDKKTVWLNIVKAIVWNESEWDPNNRYIEKTQGIDPITGKRNESVGLLQLSCGDVLISAYQNLPSAEAFDCRKHPGAITDPVANLNFGLEVMSFWAGKGGSVDISSTKSLGAYWSSARMDATKSRKKMRELMPECFR